MLIGAILYKKLSINNLQLNYSRFADLGERNNLPAIVNNISMDILIEIIADFFTVLFGSEANKLGADREVPNWVKILFLILAVAFIAGVLYFCRRLSE